VRADVSRDRLKPVAWLFGPLLVSSLVLGWGAHFTAILTIEPWVMAVDVAIVLAFVGARWSDVRSLITSRLPRARSVVEMAVIALLFFAVMSLAFGLLHWLTVPFSEMTQDYLDAGWPLWAIFVSTSVQ
jgi:hypothetical protein